MEALERAPTRINNKIVRDELSVPFIRPFEVISAAHIAARQAVKELMPRSGAVTLLFVVRGRLDFSSDEKHLALEAGEAFLTESKVIIASTFSHGSNADFYLLRFLRTEVPAGVPRRTLKIPNHVAIHNPGRLKHLFHMLLEARRDCPHCPLIFHHLVILMLCEMTSSNKRAAVRVGVDGLECMASRVDAYIAAHYHEHIGTPDIAREFRYNPDYLERAYRTKRHRSIRAAIHFRRIREAQAQLLLQRSRGIADIAALCGFVDVGHFRRAFKRAVHMTPHEFRSQQSGYRRGIHPLHSV
jgi:AraC-like DNA-binding protein